MKYLILLFVCAMATFNLLAQDQEHAFSRSEIGLNATTFMTNFLSLSDESANPGNYLLNYRRYSANNKAMRIGLNLNVTSQQEKIDFNTNQTINTQLINLRVGWEKQYHIKPKWTFLTGLDILLSYNNFKVSTTQFDDFVTSSNRVVTAGTGPYLGVQFNINDRIGLFTESTFYFTYRQERSKDAFSDFPTEDISEKLNTFAFNSTFPTAIFFFVKF